MFTSKTLWVNAVAVLASFLAARFGYELSAETQVGILVIINGILRLITKEPIKWDMAKASSLFFVACLVCLLPGCAAYTEYSNQAHDLAGQASDAALNEGLWIACDQASVGSIKRKIGNDADKIKAWQELCEEAGTPVAPIVVSPECAACHFAEAL